MTMKLKDLCKMMFCVECEEVVPIEGTKQCPSCTCTQFLALNVFIEKMCDADPRIDKSIDGAISNELLDELIDDAEDYDRGKINIEELEIRTLQGLTGLTAKDITDRTGMIDVDSIVKALRHALRDIDRS